MLDGAIVARPFIKATQEILAVMAGMDSAAGAPFVKKNNIAKGGISAIVRVTGDKTGTIAVSFSHSCAQALAKGMLGDDIQDIQHDTQDAVGEVANMISGQGRAALVNMGLNLKGSPPTVIVGEGHAIRHISAGPTIAIPFTTDHGEFTVEFCWI